MIQKSSRSGRRSGHEIENWGNDFECHFRITRTLIGQSRHHQVRVDWGFIEEDPRFLVMRDRIGDAAKRRYQLKMMPHKRLLGHHHYRPRSRCRG